MIAMALLAPKVGYAEPEFGWNGSSFIKDSDEGFFIKFGGRIMSDWALNSGDSSLDAAVSGIEDGTRFRRVRLFSAGTIYHVVEYKLQFDFAGGDVAFKDVFIGLKGIPFVGGIRVGHQYEPAGLETITSSKVITFMERASVSTLMPERNTGIQAFNKLADDRLVLAVGMFTASNEYGDAVGNDYAWTGRVAGLPIKNEENNRLLHLGVSGSYREAEDGEFQVKAKPENPIAPSFLDTEIIFADTITLLGTEAAGIWGPISLQGEYAFVSVVSDSAGDPNFSSYYVQAAYTLTGEARGYKSAQMGGIVPKRNYDGKGGIGAFELAARYSTMDLSDEQVLGGEYSVLTLGVNWYLNPYTRVMVNYAYTDYTGVGKMKSLMTRFQVSF